MSDKDDNVVAFPNPWESRKEEDEPVWHVIRNEYSENFEAWVVTATSKTSGEVTSYGTFPNMGSVQLFLTYFNFDETKEQKHELFIIQVSKLNQIRVVPESGLDWEKDWNQLRGEPNSEIVSWNQMAWDVYGNVSGEKNAMKKHEKKYEKKYEYEPEGDK